MEYHHKVSCLVTSSVRQVPILFYWLIKQTKIMVNKKNSQISQNYVGNTFAQHCKSKLMFVTITGLFG